MEGESEDENRISLRISLNIVRFGPVTGREVCYSGEGCGLHPNVGRDTVVFAYSNRSIAGDE